MCQKILHWNVSTRWPWIFYALLLCSQWWQTRSFYCHNQSHENSQNINKPPKPGPSGSIVTPSRWKQFVYFGSDFAYAVRLPQIVIRAPITASCVIENRSQNKYNISPLFFCKKKKLKKASVSKNTSKTCLHVLEFFFFTVADEC